MLPLVEHGCYDHDALIREMHETEYAVMCNKIIYGDTTHRVPLIWIYLQKNVDFRFCLLSFHKTKKKLNKYGNSQIYTLRNFTSPVFMILKTRLVLG